jgi:hypothetical protein
MNLFPWLSMWTSHLIIQRLTLFSYFLEADKKKTQLWAYGVEHEPISLTIYVNISSYHPKSNPVLLFPSPCSIFMHGWSTTKRGRPFCFLPMCNTFIGYRQCKANLLACRASVCEQGSELQCCQAGQPAGTTAQKQTSWSSGVPQVWTYKLRDNREGERKSPKHVLALTLFRLLSLTAQGTSAHFWKINF